jgi:hypothetical protein
MLPAMVNSGVLWWSSKVGFLSVGSVCFRGGEVSEDKELDVRVGVWKVGGKILIGVSVFR